MIFGRLYKNLKNNATVILNEVTSTHRSSLNGATEVAGRTADLVIANPNGIDINGAEFINTSNLTLTTGNPNINNGRISSYNVLGGDIDIKGAGLNAISNDTNIYTRTLKINAKINAKNLDIRLGNNSIDANTKNILSTNDDGTENLLLDSSSLGGMYANRISLVGTNKGLGANLPPEVLATQGEILISNDGNISLGSLSANTNIVVNSSNSVTIKENSNILSKSN